ncbi:MAG: cohesin domain-containing protein [Chloroflexota bacterium]|nr:cohesin domain-containing protein [Chloroflexota bacterium]
MSASTVASGESNNPSPGDLNGDGVVDILDLILLKSMLSGQIDPGDNSDVDGNGRFNTLDIEAIISLIMGQSSSPHKGKGGGGGGGGSATVTNRIYFNESPYDSTYGPGTQSDTFTARVQIAQTGFLYNGTFTVDYDPLILQVNDVTNGDFSGNVIQMANGVDWNDAAGTLTVMPDLSAYVDGGGNGVSGMGYLCDVLFETVGSGTSTLTIDGTLYQSRSGNVSEITGMAWVNSSADVTHWYNLTTASGVNGQVTTPGEGTYPYAEGTQVAIVATPDACYEFVNWTGDTGTIGDANDASTTITMNGDYSIQANFAIIQYSLVLNANPVAGGSPSMDGGPAYDCGTAATIHANTNPCYTFTGWTPTAGVADPNAENTTVTMSQGRTLTANYVVTTYELTTSSSDGGSVTTPGEAGPYTYDCGTSAPIVATPAQCYVFDAWTGTGVTAGKVADTNSSSTTILMDGDYAVQANFIISSTFNLTVAADPVAGGTPSFDGSNPFDCGDIVSIHANPDPCYTFVNWTGSPDIADPDSADTTVQMYTEYTVTAHYTIKQYTLTTNVLPAEATTAGCTVTGGGSHDCGTSAPIQANPAGLYSFAYWTSADPGINGSTNISENVLMDSDKSVTANFVINPNTVYLEDVGTQDVGTPFTIQVMIYNVSNMAFATFDLRFDETILTYQSTAFSSAIGPGAGSVSVDPDPGNLGDNGLLRVDVDYSAYANSNGGTGVSGSGYLCEITFNPISIGTSAINFVAGEGNPAGELTLVQWIAYVDSEITPVYWINGSVSAQ